MAAASALQDRTRRSESNSGPFRARTLNAARRTADCPPNATTLRGGRPVTYSELESTAMTEGASCKDNASFWSDCERLASMARYLHEHAPDLQDDFCSMLSAAGVTNGDLRG